MLDQIEGIAQGFQDKLGALATNVSEIQNESLTYSTEISNRRKLESKIHNFLNNILLSPKLIDDLLNAEIDQFHYVQYLEKFNQILFTVSMNEDAKESVAIEDV